MSKKINYTIILITGIVFWSCKIPTATQVAPLQPMPGAFINTQDSTNSTDVNWKNFFKDQYLVALIDTALKNNLDVLTTLQDIEIAQNKVRFRNGMLYPSVIAGGGVSVEKVGRYTSQGAGDASAEITPGKPVPEHLTNFTLGLEASWEVDIWGKLRNSKKAAFTKYLSSVEGKHLVTTNLIAEIANSYYELLALDNNLDIIRETIGLLKNQFEVVKVQKEASVVTELAVKQFEAQLYNSQHYEFETQQAIVEVENKINFLLSRYPQKIERDKTTLTAQIPNQIKAGIPSQLLKNRPDIKQAELELLAAKLDVKTAELEFYPSLNITSTLGVQAFKPSYLFTLPESLLYSLAGGLMGPIINRNGIIAEFKTANAVQIQAMYGYQKTILNGFVEVANELSNISNLEKMYVLKSKEADVLKSAIDISNELFKYARANYLEVLTTQRDALETKLELVETRKRQFNSVTNMYRSLGGGWK
ncbi:MAG: efflux transporter outer membrane subunit [Sphingobacteriia bacterium]|jgi:NodT family efflux transporter outer membrane factor (OMF) lipoprotein